MKKPKTALISLACVLAILVTSALVFFASGNNFTTARCVVTESGLVYMVYHDRLVRLNYKGECDLSTGDEIFVVFDTAFAESFPEQTKTSLIIKLSDGDSGDIELSNEYRELIEQLGLVIE